MNQDHLENSSNLGHPEPAPSLPHLSHLNPQGEAYMVDVSGKVATVREAVAQAQVKMQPQTLAAIVSGNTPKGDVLATARIAGIMAAKQTAHLIPLCNPLLLHRVEVQLTADQSLPGFCIRATV